MTTTPDALFDYLVTRGVEIIRERWSNRSCIASTRIAQEVIRSLGGECYPLAVKLDIWNREAVQAVEEKWDPERIRKSSARWLAVDGSGTMSETGWDGHLVLIVKDAGREVLVDLTLDQASRPLYGIHLRPAWSVIEEGWPATFAIDDTQEVRAQYRRTEIRSYRGSADWREASRWTPDVTRILLDMSSRLKDVPPPE